MKKFIFSASVLLPEKAEQILELLPELPAYALEKTDGTLKLIVYSEKSESDALKELNKIVGELIKSAEDLKISLAPVDNIELNKFERDRYLLNYQNFLKPFKVKDRIYVVPLNSEFKNNADFAIPVIFLDSLLAFGTGAHPTTRMCLEYLAEKDLSGKVVVDAGTGSGILAIAAAKLGAKCVHAFDNDSTAVSVAERNVKLNGVRDKVEVFKSGLEVLRDLKADIIIANLTSEIILENHSYFKNSDSEALGLSGFLVIEEERVAGCFKEFKKGMRLENSGWVFQEFLRG